MRKSLNSVCPSLMIVLAGAMLLSTGCAQQRNQAAADEQAYQAPVFAFQRADLSGSAASGFHPIQNSLYPTLPTVVDESTSAEDLSSMALQFALAEEARGAIDLSEVDHRQRDILAFWQPQHEVLKAVIAEANGQREYAHQYELAELSKRSAWERNQAAIEAGWDEKIRLEKMRVLPLVPPDLQARLIVQMRTADPQRSRWCGVAP